MPEGDALLAAVLDNPQDDTPRLVYADWLDEHGTSAGERARAELDLPSNRIGDRGALALASSPHREGLTSLVLRHNGFDTAARLALGRHFGDRVVLD
jgi:uncharacterized protein (TIGR02996 family)